MHTPIRLVPRLHSPRLLKRAALLAILAGTLPSAWAITPMLEPIETPIGQLAMLVLPDSLTVSPDASHLAFGTKVGDPSLLDRGIIVDSDKAPVADRPGANNIRMILDGKPLPPCHLLMPMAFSPDSQHRGYAFCIDNRWQISLDDKTAMSDLDRVPGNPVVFSPDSKHTAIVGHKGGKTLVVVDGTPWPDVPTSDGGMLKFSPDSQHLALLAHIGTQWTFYLDGKPLAEDSATPPKRPSHFQRIADYTWMPDSHSLAITGSVPGKAWQLFTTSDSAFVSPPVAAGVVKSFPRFPSLNAAAPTDAARLVFVTPAPDKHWHFRTESTGTKPMLYASFRPESVNYIRATTGPAKLVYLAQDDDGWHLFIDGQPFGELFSSVVENTFIVSPDALHYAFAAKRQAQTILIRDGQTFATPSAVGVGTFAYSPDSAHLAYGVKQLDGTIASWHIAIDTDIGVGSFLALPQQAPVFSPDSKTLAYTAMTSVNQWRLIVGMDVAAQTRQYPAFLEHTPIAWKDNTHLTAIALPKHTATRLDVTLPK